MQQAPPQKPRNLKGNRGETVCVQTSTCFSSKQVSSSASSKQQNKTPGIFVCFISRNIALTTVVNCEKQFLEYKLNCIQLNLKWNTGSTERT